MTSRTPSLIDEILKKFPAHLREPLIEFNKHVSDIDADYIVFMARKALRLHDLLVLGTNIDCKIPIISQHVLNQNLSRFRGKRIALVDDTLILGTTLARTKKKLLDAGALDVSTHVFCADVDNSCADLVQPNKVFSHMDEQQVLNFCAAEVSALASFGIPYLSDFPMSQGIRMSRGKLIRLQGLFDWESFDLSTGGQKSNSSYTYTFLPKSETVHFFHSKTNWALGPLIEIFKVRAFIRYTKGSFWVRLVPVVTCSPLSAESIDAVFEEVISGLLLKNDHQRDELLYLYTTPTSKLRFIQYCIALLVGRFFVESWQNSIGEERLVNFDQKEAMRHFGFWLKDTVEDIHTMSTEDLSAAFGTRALHSSIEIPPFPAQVTDNCDRAFSGAISNGPDAAGYEERGRRNYIAELTNSFIYLFREFELPARQSVKELGREVIDHAVEDVPPIDRLNYGFAWTELAKKLIGRDTTLTSRRINLLSLVLDSLVDMGVAVPILTERQGVLFRAYRHGEDVLFGNQEIALGYDILAGYQEGSGRDDVPKIIMEKLLVSLIRVGSAREFLETINGTSGSEGIARIGYHLHGAVPFLPSSSTYIAEARDSWLSKHMEDRGVIQKNSKGMFTTYERPPASLRRSGVDKEIRQLGWLIGKAISAKIDRKPIFTSDDLVVLTSCTGPKDTTGALAVEFRLIAQQCERRLPRPKKVNWNNSDSVSSTLSQFVGDIGYTAINSALIKFTGFKNKRPIEAVRRVEEYFKSLENGLVLANAWNANWQFLLDDDFTSQHERFDRIIQRLGGLLLDSALGFATLELALVAASSKKDSGAKVSSTCEKWGNFLHSLLPLLSPTRDQKRLISRLDERLKSHAAFPKPADAYAYGYEWLERRKTIFSNCSSQALDMVGQFGKSERRWVHKYYVWYDIIDSTGQKSGLSGEHLDEYRERVQDFKQGINNDLNKVRIDCSNQNAALFTPSGTLYSKDDEKRLFVSGARGLSWVQTILETLLDRADAHDVKLRVIVINADFAHVSPYSVASSPIVEGDPFWEHFSRVEKHFRNLENEDTRLAKDTDSRSNFAWIGGDLRHDLDVTEILRFEKQIFEEVITDMDNIPLRTQFVGGRLSN